MVSKNKPDCPPPGWKIQTKLKNGRKYKYYINLKTHQKFYSKLSMLRCIEGGVSTENSRQRNEHSNKTSGKKQMQLVQVNNYEWLPSGWVVERRIRKSGSRKGTEYKCFIDQSTGSKFFSKPEVLRHLRSKQLSAGFSSRKDKGTSGHFPSRVVVEKSVDEDLPSGWIKETRIRMLGNKVVRRDASYVDPASRLVFQSKSDVLRYLETGEISRHAYQRRNGQITGESLAITIASSTKEATAKSRTRKQLAGEGNSTQSIKAPLKAKVQEKSDGKRTRTSLRVRSAPANASNSSRDILSEEKSMAVIEYCNDKKVQTTKRKKDGNPPCTPSRSSKRLAGVSAEVVFLPIPIEHALRATNRKPSDIKPISSIPSLASVPDEKLEMHQDVRKDLNEAALESSRRKSSRTNPLPSLEPIAKNIHENCKDDDTKILNECGREPVRRKSSRTKSSPKIEPVSKKMHENCYDVDTKILNEGAREPNRRKSSRTKPLPSMEPVPKKLYENCNDVDTKILNEGAREPDRRKSSRTKTLPSMEPVPKKIHENCNDVYTNIIIINEGAREPERRKSSRIKCMPSMESSPKELHENCNDVVTKILNEGAREPDRRKSSRTKPLPSMEPVPKKVHENCNDVDLNEGAREPERRKSSRIKYLPSMESSPKKINENCEDVDTKTLNEGVTRPMVRRKSSRSKPIPCSKFIPDGLHEMQEDVDKEIVFATQEPPLMRVNDLNFQEENHHTIDVGEKIVVGIQEPLNKIDSKSTSFVKQCQTIDQKDSETALASHKESFYKIDNLTLFSTQGEPSSKIDNLTTKRPILVDLNELILEAPPGFSENTKFGASTITEKQPVEHPIDTTLVGSKVENEKQTKQPESEPCLTAPLWSDPCLEFAYKTLTGAIPLDDNVAIEDYIQHQLRALEESPDMGPPGFFRNDDSKQVSVSPLPEDVNLLNPNNFRSQEIKQGKNK